MATITSNIGEVTGNIRAKLAKLTDKEYIPRLLSFDLIDLMTKRIHINGLASNESAIGSYNKQYLSLRRRKFSRSTDTKIIVSLTRQLENDWSVIATDQGYGIGFKNPFNFDKARWVESNKNVKIFNLSSTELKYVTDTVQKLTTDALK
jgi:hypothetical protein